MTRSTLNLRVLLFLSALAVSGFVWAGTHGPSPSEDGGKGAYWRRDWQHFKPPMADVRRPHTHMRVYCDQAVPFTVSDDDSSHFFWDVGFARSYTLFGYKFDDARTDRPTEASGIALFVEPAAHMLLDFDANSAAVINTDFRLGGGLAARFPRPLQHVSARLRFFHESTHLGDEYVLDATHLGTSAGERFQRYDVSYEAVDLFAAGDGFLPVSWGGLYARVYGGHRWLLNDEFEAFVRRAPTAPLRSGKSENQFGFELIQGIAPGNPVNILSRIPRISPSQHVFLAADLYRRQLYQTSTSGPEQAWGKNIALGLIWGNYFEVRRGLQPLALSLSYYDGPNPHGQLREEAIHYWGFDFSIGF